MKKIGSLLILVLVFSFFTNTIAYASGPSSKIEVIVNKNTVKYDKSPYLKKGEVMVPVRQTSEALGAKVTWDKKNKTAWVHLGMMHVELPVGKSEFYIHRDADFSGIPQTVKLSTPIKSASGRVFVPGIAFYEGIGMNVAWDSSKRVLSITKEALQTEVPYEVITVDAIKDSNVLMKWYDENKEKSGVSYIRKDQYVYVIIGAGEKSTGGYSISIEEVSYSLDDTVMINATVTPPGEDMNVIMALTYPSILIRIKSDTVKAVVGEIRDSKNSDIEELVAMYTSAVISMELYDLDQVKLRDITESEKDDIIKSFSEATLDENAYIFMITGNILKITLKNGYVITFTSYGSKSNVLAALEKDGETRSFHIVDPVIAKILLEK